MLGNTGNSFYEPGFTSTQESRDLSHHTPAPGGGIREQHPPIEVENVSQVKSTDIGADSAISFL